MTWPRPRGPCPPRREGSRPTNEGSETLRNIDASGSLRFAAASGASLCALLAHAACHLRGVACIDRQEHPFPDLVITDLKMPNVTGLQLLEWLKGGTQYRRLPVVVMTSSSQSTDIDRAYALGANAYFLKPTRLEDLIALCGHITAFWFHAIRYRATSQSPSTNRPHGA